MKPIALILIRISCVLFSGAFMVSVNARAQEKAASSISQSRAYDLRREVSLQGTVVEYKVTSATPPLGAHVSLQTSSGIVDVHLGNSQLLAANHFSLSPGDSLRVYGENRDGPQGSLFVARIIQKGTQALTVRSLQGIPLKPRHASGAQKQQGGVL